MPNMKGGKKYKSSKHADTRAEFHDIGEGQSIARVLKHLGDRNVLVYCNDGRERIAHIRGGLTKKKGFIEVGDIVLISNRAEEMDSLSKKMDRADILAKYDRSLYNQLKKMEGVNSNLFLQVEIFDTDKIEKMKQEDEDVGFEFASEEDISEEEEEAGPDGATTEEAKKMRKLKKEEKVKEREQKLREARSKKEEDEFNIDDI